MTPKEKIAKLEGLLARVKDRAEAPRPNGATAFAVAPLSARSSAIAARPAPPAHVSEPPPPASKMVTSPPQAAAWSEPPMDVDLADGEVTLGAEPGDDDEGADEETQLHARAAVVAVASEVPVEMSADAEMSVEGEVEMSEIDVDGYGEMSVEGDAELVVVEGDAELSVDGDAEVSIDGDSETELEVTAEVVEMEVELDDPAAMPAESGAQPVAEHVDDGPSAELEEVTEELIGGASMPPVALANEVEEPAPTSSPRPIAAAATSYEVATSYDEEPAHRHTPPPESGKQVAAASVKPDVRPSSEPPSEGHTLVGGWREPGMAIPRDPVSGPARIAPPPPPPPPRAVEPVVHAAPAAARPSRSASNDPTVRLGPEVTRVDLPGDASVALVEGAAPSFTVSTFGELLDASLSL